MRSGSLIAVCLLGLSPVTAEPAPVGVLVVEQARGLHPAVLPAMRAEAGKILTPAGVRICWSDADGGGQAAGQRRLVVVRLVSAGSAGVAVKGSDGVLAITHMAEGRILPFVDLDVERVGRSIPRLGGFGRAIQPQEYGRALGRVLAHELYHVLSGSAEHDSEGVAKRALNGLELVKSELNLSAQACRRIREPAGLAVQP